MTAQRAGWQSRRDGASACPRCLGTPGAIPQLSWDLRCCSSKHRELKRRLPGGRQEACHKRAAALTGEDMFNAKERQCLPRIRDLCVVFSSPCVIEMPGLIKPVNLQSKQNHPGAGTLPGALCVMCAAHQGISRIALLREKDLQLL